MTILLTSFAPWLCHHRSNSSDDLLVSMQDIAFLIHKRYIPDPERLNQQRFKCAAQMREPL
ncbi:hypothetical protein PN446_08555 [Microcystis aeruginosa CS-567/02]|nr:hypothetical protein [Microcystis aeruginosa]MDB9412614.1 hypothetical protein [Microcystis aeruginosa CS-567/02]